MAEAKSLLISESASLTQEFSLKEKSLTPELRRIHEGALLAAREFKKAEEHLIDSLIETERTSVHLRLGFSSLFKYATDCLKLSEATSYNAIAVARKAREIPELKKEIQEIGISKVRKIVSVLTRENQKEWIEKAKNFSSRALEKAVAKESPRAATPESARYVSEKRLDLRLGVSEGLMLKVRRAQDQVSRSLGKAASLEDTLEAITTFYLQHKDPFEKAKRVIAKKGVQTEQGRDEHSQNQSPNKLFTGTVLAASAQSENIEAHSRQQPRPRPLSHPRRPIPAAIAHQIRVRDENQCQAQRPGGGICGEKRWTDLHHVLPVSQGGSNETRNLITLCRSHHQEHHRRS